MILNGSQCLNMCVVFSLFGLSVSRSDEMITTKPPDPTYTLSDEEVTTTEPLKLSEEICSNCNCTGGVIDCANRDIRIPFEFQDWDGLKPLNPKTVDLSQNPLTAVTRVSRLPLQSLNYSGCEITSIEEASFVYLPELVTLDLSRNRISSDKLTRRVFVGPITSDKGPTTFKNLTFLSLASNDIHSLPQDLFIFMPELTTLDLSGNPLAFIDQVTMAAITDLLNLRELYLSSCELETLPEGLFRRQRRLRRLDLSGNHFTTVPAVLKEAVNLVYLNFGKNTIQSLEKDNPIRSLTKLQDLRLCRNSKLRNITSGALAGLPQLVSLHICYNPRLTVIDANFLTFTDDHDNEIWPTLTELYLNNNNLSTINSAFLDRWDQLAVVDVTSNPYTCDCSNQWLVDVLVPMVGEQAGRMICKKPLELRGLSFAQLHNSSRMLVCKESEDLTELPVPDMAILLGIMIGIFVTFPIVLIIVLLWRRGYFSKYRFQRKFDEEDYESDAF